MTTVTIGDQDIEVSHPDKVLFPGAGLTKSDLVAYYRRVADHMLPHVGQRPVALERTVTVHAWPAAGIARTIRTA